MPRFNKPFGKFKGRDSGFSGSGFKSRRPKDSDRDSGFGKRDSGFSKRDSGFSRPRSGGLELFDVTCASCGKETQVPFRPTGDKPVLCRDCFKSDGGDRPARRNGASRGDDLAEINRKLDKIMRALKIE